MPTTRMAPGTWSFAAMHALGIFVLALCCTLTSGQVWDDTNCDFIAIYSSSVYARQSSSANTLTNTGQTGNWGVMPVYSSAAYIHVNVASSNTLLTSSDYGVTWSSKSYTMQINNCISCGMVRDASGKYLAAYISPQSSGASLRGSLRLGPVVSLQGSPRVDLLDSQHASQPLFPHLSRRSSPSAFPRARSGRDGAATSTATAGAFPKAQTRCCSAGPTTFPARRTKISAARQSLTTAAESTF